MKNINLAVALVATFMLCACGGETSQEREAKNIAAATNQAPITSCNSQDMGKLGLNILSWDNEADVCLTMQTSLGRLPSVSLVQKLSVAVSVLQAAGNKDSAKDISYQMMSIVEARGQEQDDKAIDSTFETASKIVRGTQGHVTLKDLAIFLKDSGSMAKTLSDEGLINMAAVIWEDKKARSE